MLVIVVCEPGFNGDMFSTLQYEPDNNISGGCNI